MLSNKLLRQDAGMKGVLITIIVFLVGGCAIRSVSYYEPTQAEFLRREQYCGWVPYGDAVVPIGRNTLSLRLRPTQNGIGVGLQIPLPEGETIQFDHALFGLKRGPAEEHSLAELRPFRISVYGRDGEPGHHLTFAATAPLTGFGRNKDLISTGSSGLDYDLFISSLEFETGHEDNIFLTIPPLKVNGHSVALDPIEFVLVEKTAIYACVQ